MGYVDLHFECRSGCDGILRFRAVAGYGADWTRGGGASRFFCKPFYADFRPVSFARRSVGGMLIAEIVGHLLQWTGSYMIPFFMAASAYLVALLLIHLLSPKLMPARIGY